MCRPEAVSTSAGAGGRPGMAGAVPCPLHPGSRVVRNGTVTTQSGRMQKYFCQPPDGSRHTFTAAVPGGAPDSRPPRGHRYNAAVIARALHALARGATYRQARIAALGGQPMAGLAAAGTVTTSPADAKLVSRWLDTFAPLLRQELATPHAPVVTLARAVPVGRRPAGPVAAPSAGHGGQWLLCLTGWSPGDPPRVWPAVIAERPDEAAWRALFWQCGDRPALLLCESPFQEAAAVSVWGPYLAGHPGQRPRPGIARRRMLTWAAPAEEDPVTGYDTAAGSREAQRAAAAADAMVRCLAGRAASIRSQDRADVLLALMALEVSGLATAESMAAILQGSRSGR